MVNRARVHIAAGDFENAIRDLREAYGNATDQYGWNIQAGVVAYHNGDFEQAFEMANRALQIMEGNPKSFAKPDPESLYLRGLAKIRKGDRSGGESDIQIAERTSANSEMHKRMAPDGVGKSLCYTGLSLEAALKAGPAQAAGTAPDKRAPPDTRIVDQTESFTRLVAWQSAMKQINVPSLAPHLFVTPACAGCRPMAVYCKMPIQDLAELKTRRVGVAASEKELESELSTAGALVSIVHTGDAYRALDTSFVDCLAGR